MTEIDRGAFEASLAALFEENGITPPSEAQTEAFYRLTAHLLAENERYNLTAITDLPSILLRHYADSVCCEKYIPESATLLDVGCGAGFPTLPLAIMRPDLRITAMDATKKRVDFVADCASLLGLSNVRAVCGRAEELAAGEMRASFDCVTARAVAELRVLAELCIPFVREGGIFLSMKAKSASEELAAAQAGIGTLGARLSKREDFALTGNGEILDRAALLFKKVRPTPPTYPRPFARIKKKPL